jgi:hypothetical protein
MFVFKHIVRVLIAYGYPIPTVRKYIIPEHPVLNPPAQEYPGKLIMMAVAIFNDRAVGSRSWVKTQTISI